MNQIILALELLSLSQVPPVGGPPVIGWELLVNQYTFLGGLLHESADQPYNSTSAPIQVSVDGEISWVYKTCSGDSSNEPPWSGYCVELGTFMRTIEYDFGIQTLQPGQGVLVRIGTEGWRHRQQWRTIPPPYMSPIYYFREGIQNDLTSGPTLVWWGTP
jgi:hypothetical protein